jgi:hypothetical protein
VKAAVDAWLARRKSLEAVCSAVLVEWARSGATASPRKSFGTS